MLRMNKLSSVVSSSRNHVLSSLTLLAILMVAASAFPCPSSDYRGSIYSGIPILIQRTSWSPWMEERYPSKKVKILSATIIVYLMHLQQYLMCQCLFTVFKQKLLKIYFSLLSQLNQKVFLFCHSLSELNGPTQNGIKSHLVLLLKIETIYNQDITK